MSVAASTVCLATGITHADLVLEHSHDGHHLLICHGAELLAIYGAMGGQRRRHRVRDGKSYSVEEVLDPMVAG